METIITEVSQGRLRGCKRSNLDGDEFYSFMGVPFAEPPVGDLRFKAPVPCKPWFGVRDATKEGDGCYQRGLISQAIEGSEDCLNLNVYTKSLPSHGEKNYPVMVWLYGGGFSLGSNKTDVHGPEYLMTQDIVLVVINYRVGVFGFLCLEDGELEVPGNAGLKDQREALRWVQTNIRSFNGDPGNVTIFGVSAGSASVHFHVLSPSSKDLFHKAIMQSGVSLNPFARSSTKVTELMEVVGINVNSEREALEILRSWSAEQLFAAQEKLIMKRGTMLNLFAPVVEKPNPTELITKPAMEILMSGEYNKVPMIMGYTADEGLVIEFEKAMQRMRGIVLEEKPPNVVDLLPTEMGVTSDSELAGTIMTMLKDTYFSGANALISYLCWHLISSISCLRYVTCCKMGYLMSAPSSVIQLVSDAVILAGIYLAIRHHLKTSPEPIYLYKMKLDAGLNFLKLLAKLDDIPGACHGDDVGYLFRTSNRYLEETGGIEEQAVRRYVKLWTNFAKYGNPTPNEQELGVVWRPVSKTSLCCLEIGSDLTVTVDPEGDRLEVWDRIYHLSPNTKDY